MNTNLIAKFDSYCGKFGISTNRAAQAIGYTASVLSQWRKGTYKGKEADVDAKVEAWLDLQMARVEAGTVPYIPLRRTDQIKTALRVVQEEKVIGLILGNSGAGKSKGLEEFASENPNTTVLIKCDPTMGLSTLVTSLARQLGLDTKGRLSEISDRLVQELRKRDLVVMLDEADYLGDSVMEWARIAINDKGGSGLVFAGLPRIQYRIKSLKGDHRQLENRVGMVLLLDDVDASEIQEVLTTIWPDIDQEAVKAFTQASRASLHLLVRSIALVKRALRSDDSEIAPSAELVKDAARFLMR